MMLAAAATGVEIRPWRPGDEASICRLFTRTFGRAKSVDHWRWEFLGQGSEPHVMVATDSRGEVVAHFGGVPRRFRVFDEPWTFSLAVDSMVAPELRCGLKRRGLFARVVEGWVDWFGGGGRLAVGYGLPNRAAFRIGRRLLGYTPLTDAVLQVRETRSAPIDGASGASESDVPVHDHDDLWARCRVRQRVLGVRDHAFWAWRYAAAPGGGFRFVLARSRGELAAAAVFSPSYVEPDCAAIADLLWDGSNETALAACVLRCEELAAAAGRHHIVALFPDASPEADALRALGYRPVPTGMPLVARSFDGALPLESTAGRWWFSLGDFDLV